MQIVNTFSGAFASLSFIANQGKLYKTNDCFRSRRLDRSLHNVSSESVFQEAEELISELPKQVAVKPPPFERIHESLIRRDKNYVESEPPFPDESSNSSLQANRIKTIIQTSFGIRENLDEQEKTEIKQPQQKVKKKYGPGRPLSMKIWMNIGTNDLITRCKRARKFIEDGIPVMFKIEGQGATANYMTHAQVIVNTAMSVLSDVAKLGGGLQQHANFLSQIFNPIEGLKRGSNAKESAGSAPRDVVTGKGRRVNKDYQPSVSSSTGQPSDIDESDHTNVQTNYNGCNGKAGAETYEPVLDGGKITRNKGKRSPVNSEDDAVVIHGLPSLNDVYFHTTEDEKHGRYASKDEDNLAKSADEHNSGEKGNLQWMDANKRGRKKNDASKFMTIEKKDGVDKTEQPPSTVKNDAMLKRFMAMRNGTTNQGYSMHASPANLPPTPPVLNPFQAMQPGMQQYDMPLPVAPPPPPPYMVPYDTPQTYQEFPWQHANPMYRRSQPSQYRQAGKWLPEQEMGVPSLPKTPAAAAEPRQKSANPAANSKSRWIKLDKNKS